MRPLVALALLALASGETFQRRPRLTDVGASSSALRVRGGVRLIDKAVAAKVLTASTLVQGTSLVLAPKKTAEAYGRECTPLSEFCTCSAGAVLVGLGVLTYALLENMSSTHGAIGAGLLAITLGDSVRLLLNDFPGQFGFNKYGLISNTLFQAVTTHALLTNQDYADSMTKALCAFGALNSVVGVASPVSFAKSWGLPESQMDDGYVHILCVYCWSLLSFCVITAALLLDVEAYKSLAYGVSVSLVGVISENFISKRITKSGMKPGLQYTNMLVLAAVVFSVFFGEDPMVSSVAN